MNFVAIDFETANEKRYSACSIGVTKVVDNEIVDEKYWLIKPPEMRFVPQNLWIHGICPEMVENEKTFDLIWEEIKPYIEENLVVAHNATFDISVLRSLLDYYKIEYPNFYYVCTVMLSKNHIPNLKNHKLNTLAEYVGHEFKHHHAGEDATACAKVMIHICEKLNINSLVSLNIQGGIKLGAVYKGGYEPTSSLIKHKNKVNKSSIINFKNLNYETKYFKDKVVVFTGPLINMKRPEAYVVVKKLGGIIGTSVTKKTEIIVTGIKNVENLDRRFKTTKLKKAEYLMNEGQKIEILTEEEFVKLSIK